MNSNVVFYVVLRICLCAALSPVSVSLAETTEYQVKAAYLYQLTQFIEWPATTFDTQEPIFRFCVLGDDPTSQQLKPLSKRTHNGLPIILDYPQSINAVRGCHLLYIAASDIHHEANILKKFKDVPMLTVSSQPSFAARGGMIAFVIIDKRVRLVINRIVARDAGIELSAKLLEVAVAYNDDPYKDAQP